MQMLFDIPDDIAERFKTAIPDDQRSAFIANLMNNAFSGEDDEIPNALTQETLRKMMRGEDLHYAKDLDDFWSQLKN